MYHNLVLVGMPGAGKTTLGKKLAAKLNYTFIDTDYYIANLIGRSIPDIFAEYGETWFRNKETEAIKRLLLNKAQVIATGGGLPCFNNNMDVIKAASYSIYLDLPVEILIQRINNAKTARPMFAGKSGEEALVFLKDLHNSRKHFYLQANLVSQEPEQLLAGNFTATLPLWPII